MLSAIKSKGTASLSPNPERQGFPLPHRPSSRTLLKGFVCPAAATPVFLIDLPSGFCLEAEYLAIVQRCHALLDDVSNGIRRTIQFTTREEIPLSDFFEYISKDGNSEHHSAASLQKMDKPNGRSLQ